MIYPLRLILSLFLFVSCLSAAENTDLTAFGDLPQDLFTRAARDGDVAMMRQLMEAYPDEIDINFSNDSLLPPLHKALHFRRTEAALWLIDAGAKTSMERRESYPSNSHSVDPLALAVMTNDQVVLRRLLELGERPQLVFRDFYPINVAVNNDYIECLDLLMEYGVDPFERDYFAGQGREPIHLGAALWGAHRVLERLLEAGADPNYANSYGLTPLHLAAGSRSPEAVALLLAAGADVNARFKWGPYSSEVTPLMRAVESDNLVIVEKLLAAGADVSVAANRALYGADVLGNRKIYDRLLQAGARREPFQFTPEKKRVLYESTEVGVSETLDQALAVLAEQMPVSALSHRDQTSTDQSAKPVLATFFDEDSANLAGLIVAHLTENKELELLERSRLDAIQAEAELRSSAMTAEALTTALALTPADHALVMTGNRRDGDNTLAAIQVRLVALDSGTILRTWLLLPDASMTGDATGVLAQSISGWLRHRSEGADPTLAVLGHFPIAESMDATHPIANDFNLLLEQVLASSEGLRLLDRRGLDRILSEQALGGESGDGISAGGWFIEGGLLLREDNQIIANIRLTDGKEESISQQIGPASPTETAQAAAAWILAETGSRDSSFFDRRAEASRLLRLANWSMQADQFEEAIRLADAAWALEPEWWRTRQVRLDARRASLRPRLQAFRDFRSGRDKRLLYEHLREGAMFSQDPLEWYDFDMEPEQLLQRVQEMFRLIATIATEHPERVTAVSPWLSMSAVYENATEVFAWFNPIYRQEGHASGYQAAKLAARQASEALIAAFDKAPAPGGENYFLRNMSLIQMLVYFYEEPELEVLLRRSIHDAAHCRRPSMYTIFGNYDWFAFRRSRPHYAYPQDFWSRMGAELQEESDVPSRLAGMIIASATEPLARNSTYSNEIVELLYEGPKKLKHRLLPRAINRAMPFSGTRGSGSLVREYREFVEAEDLPTLSPRSLGATAGYNDFYLHQARLIRRMIEEDYRHPEIRHQLARKESITQVKQFIQELTWSQSEVDAIDPKNLEFIEPTWIFHPFAHDPSIVERFDSFGSTQRARMIVTDHALWVAYRMNRLSKYRDHPNALVYRLDPETRGVRELVLPKAFAGEQLMGRARIAIAESESHILFSVPQGGLIGIFDKSNEEWDLLKDYRGGSEAFAVNDGFVFSARVGPQEVSRNNHLSPFHAVVLHYDTQTGKIRRLADNRKVPPDYQFETPGVAFMNLRLSEERDSFSLCGMVFHPRDGNRIRSFRGRVRIADGEYSKSTIRRVRQRDLQIGSDKFWVEKAAGSLHDGRSLFLKNQRTLVKFGLHEHELPVDISAIHSIVEKMAISANHRLHPNDPTTRSTPLIDPQPAGYLGDSFAILDATTVQLYSITRMKEVIQANQKYENH